MEECWLADPTAPRTSLAEFTREIEPALREAGYQGPFVRDAARGLLGTDGDGSLSIPHRYEQLAAHSRELRRELLSSTGRALRSPTVTTPIGALSRREAPVLTRTLAST
jgi:hypothetical protein